MNVPDHTALALLKAFARFEFALKQFPAFVRGQPGTRADTQWSAYSRYVRNDDFIDRISPASRAVLLGSPLDGPPPLKMMLDAERRVVFQDVALDGSHPADHLMDSARRVRNTLIHGGKERGTDERFPGHDRRLVDAALEVIGSAMRAHADVRRFCEVPDGA